MKREDDLAVTKEVILAWIRIPKYLRTNYTASHEDGCMTVGLKFKRKKVVALSDCKIELTRKPELHHNAN